MPASHYCCKHGMPLPRPPRRRSDNRLMLKFAANLSMMFNEFPFLDRFSAAADAGFQGVEYLFPFEFPVEAIEERLRKHHLENVLFNLAPGNWSAGERGIT